MCAAGSLRHLTLDAGALIAYERGDRTMRARIDAVLTAGMEVLIPAGVLAQVWRDRRRQRALENLLRDRRVTVMDLDEYGAKGSGALCGQSNTSDVVDASVVICARMQRPGTVLTSDPDDICHLDPRLDVEPV